MAAFAQRETASGILTIDLAALAQNYRDLQSRLAGARLGAVVKANAYGLGAARVAQTLRQQGCRDFFVAHLEEALSLKQELQKDSNLFVLNGLHPGSEERCAAADVIPVLNSLAQIQNWSACARRQGVELPAVLQFDTGMSRLGLSADEANELIGNRALLDGIRILFVMSHLACADDPDSAQNEAQRSLFEKYAASFSGVPRCFANSGGVFLGSAFHGELGRAGIALYGANPVMAIDNPMAAVVSLHVRVIQLRSVPAGARVGYGGVFVAPQPMRLATIAAGYADGMPRHLSNCGAAYFNGVRLPFVGRVSMDSITLDISALPADAIAPGALVEVIGPHQSLEAVAEDAGTISYEILTALGQRYYREYV